MLVTFRVMCLYLGVLTVLTLAVIFIGFWIAGHVCPENT